MSKTTASGQTRIAVIGAGSWATALVKILSENATVSIFWWMRSEEQMNYIQTYRHNPKYLSDIEIDLSKVTPSTDCAECIRKAEIVVLALPAAFISACFEQIDASIFQGKIVFSAVKGMVPESGMLPSEYLNYHVKVAQQDIGIIAGPCHSEEVALERQSFLTVSSGASEHSEKMAALLTCRYIKTHIIDNDVQGIEYGAVMKNIFALAVGIGRGLNFGDNFQSVLVSNAMREMKRFLDHSVPKAERDMNESAFLGDLLVTAYSPFSRNRIFGQMIGKGYTVKAAQVEMNMIAEGYYAVKSIIKKNETLGLPLPICEFVNEVVYKQSSPKKSIQKLIHSLR
jgi:glycerol-3-phosphate dehydrogenase (NAD(P)+)